ncbi:MAG: hypothetical protein ACRERZ_06575 [Gammaproteobacteria bacterium]
MGNGPGRHDGRPVLVLDIGGYYARDAVRGLAVGGMMQVHVRAPRGCLA